MTSTEANTMKRTHSGGCHCGAVRYEVDIDLSQGTIRCNCSICSKARAWLAAVDPTDFRLLRGADALSEYRFGSNSIHHLFCKRCGIKSFGRGQMPDGSTFIAIVVSCLEGISDEELAALPVMHVDGRNDNFQASPAETRHL
jgi:hypothetical protein